MSLANRTPRDNGTPSLASGVPGVTVSWYSVQGHIPGVLGAGTVLNVHEALLSGCRDTAVAVTVAVYEVPAASGPAGVNVTFRVWGS